MCLSVCACVCECMCVTARARARVCVCVCVCVWMYAYLRAYEYVCVCFYVFSACVYNYIIIKYLSKFLRLAYVLTSYCSDIIRQHMYIESRNLRENLRKLRVCVINFTKSVACMFCCECITHYTCKTYLNTLLMRYT